MLTMATIPEELRNSTDHLKQFLSQNPLNIVDWVTREVYSSYAQGRKMSSRFIDRLFKYIQSFYPKNEEYLSSLSSEDRIIYLYHFMAGVIKYYITNNAQPSKYCEDYWKFLNAAFIQSFEELSEHPLLKLNPDDLPLHYINHSTLPSFTDIIEVYQLLCDVNNDILPFKRCFSSAMRGRVLLEWMRRFQMGELITASNVDDVLRPSELNKLQIPVFMEYMSVYFQLHNGEYAVDNPWLDRFLPQSNNFVTGYLIDLLILSKHNWIVSRCYRCHRLYIHKTKKYNENEAWWGTCGTACKKALQEARSHKNSDNDSNNRFSLFSDYFLSQMQNIIDNIDDYDLTKELSKGNAMKCIQYYQHIHSDYILTSILKVANTRQNTLEKRIKQIEQVVKMLYSNSLMQNLCKYEKIETIIKQFEKQRPYPQHL